MMTALKKSKSPYESSASVVDGKLILSFPNAKTPVVWQMDMAEVKASALEVRGEKDPFTLVLKTTKGEAMDVAPFATKDEAVEGLVAVTRALQSAHGHIRPVTAAPANVQTEFAAAPPARKSRWGALVLVIAVLAGLWFLLGALQGPMAGLPPGATIPGDETASAPQNGVPMSADEFLNQNR